MPDDSNNNIDENISLDNPVSDNSSIEEMKKSYQEEIDKLQDSYTRLLAELVNTKKNSEFEKDKSKQSLVLKIINIVETYSLLSNEDNSSESLKNILQELNTLLSTESVKKIDININDKFDPNTSEVISTQNGEDDGLVLAVVSPAWEYKGKMIKTAKVIVSKKS